MKNLKHFLKSAFIAALSVCLVFAASCGENADSASGGSGAAEKAAYTFVMPDGAPSLSVVKLMKDYGEIDGHKINYRIVPAAQIGAYFGKSETDIALMPTNASAKLYTAQGVKHKLATVNVFGVLYMVGTKPVESLEDLKGEVIYNIGQGGTPDLMLKYILAKNNVEYEEGTEAVAGKVVLAYVSEATSAVAGLRQGKYSFAVLGQPVATNALKAVSGASVALDLQAEWKKLTGIDGYTQAGVAVKDGVAADASFMNALYNALNENYSFISQNPAEVKGILADNGSSLTFDFTKEVIDACNIDCKKASAIRADVEKYFTEIAAFDKTFIGGKLPGDDYYYKW